MLDKLFWVYFYMSMILDMLLICYTDSKPSVHVGRPALCYSQHVERHAVKLATASYGEAEPTRGAMQVHRIIFIFVLTLTKTI